MKIEEPALPASIIPPCNAGQTPAWSALSAVAAALMCLLSHSTASAQSTILGWDFNGLSGYGSSPLTPSTNLGVTTSGLVRGFGVTTTGTAAAGGWGGTGWQGSTSAAEAADLGKFAYFTVAVDAGGTLSLDGFNAIEYRRSGNGPTDGTLQYQIGFGDFVDVATLNYSSTASSGATLPAVDLSALTELQGLTAGTLVTFRIANYNAATSAGTWYLFDVGNDAGVNDFVLRGDLISGTLNYFDVNGATSGSGNPSGNFNFSDALWSVSEAGSAATGQFDEGATMVFSAGNDGTGVFTVAIDTEVNAGGIRMDQGSVTLSAALGGSLTLLQPAVTVAQGASLIIEPDLLGSAGLTKTGMGSLTLTGLSSSTLGDVIVAGGTLAVSGFGALPSSSRVHFAGLGTVLDISQSNSSTLEIGSLSAMSGSSVVLGNKALTLGGDGTSASFSGVISGDGSVTKTGAGTWFIHGVNQTFTGGLFINQGTVSVDGPARLGPLGSSVTFTGDSTLQFTNWTLSSGSGRAFVINDNVQARFDTVSETNLNYTLSGVISGGGRLVKTGAGTLALAAVNTFTGGVTILEGKLSLAFDSRLGSVPDDPTPGYLVIAGGTLQMTSTANQTLNANRGMALGPIHAAGSGTIEVLNSTTVTYNGVIANHGTDGGRLIKTGIGTLSLGGINTFTGGLEIREGTVVAGTPGALGALSGSGGVTFAGDSTLRIGGWSASSGNARFFVINEGVAATLESTDISVNHTLNGVVSGEGSLTKTGNGLLRLGGSNTYSGGTQVNAGRLFAINTSGSGTGTGAVATAASTILGGSGTIAPNGSNGIIIGGQVQPGASVSTVTTAVGTLTLAPQNGSVVFLETASIVLQIASTSSFDRLVFNSSGSGLIDFSLLPNQSIQVVAFGGYNPALFDSFDLLDWAALSGPAMTGLSADQLSLFTDGFEADWFWDTSLFESQGVISIALVPEPSRFLLTALAVASTLTRRRRSFAQS